MTQSILDNLNPAQKEAVSWPHTPLLVLAGAGSGKTRILVHRIAHLISQGVPSFNILGVTFTNKAAGEMKSRVQRLVRQDVWVSTFHSTCLRILRTDGPAIGIDRHFVIYDEHDQLVLIKECLKELNMNEKQVHPKGVRERIQRAKDFLVTPFQYAEKSPDLYEEAVAKVYQRYQEKLARLKACDFGDLIMKAVDLFDRHSDALRTWQDRFQHILIDEYQDTNHAQYRFVKLLALARQKLTVVGDPDQSIYAWRGADIKNILSFEQDYPGCGIIKMEQNYRSTTVILDAANELIQRNQLRKPKALWTERAGGERIQLFEARDEKEEAQYVVNQIRRYQSEGKTLADQVVFYRVHAQSRALEDQLRRAKIPYKIVGGIRFYDRREIKDLIAYLRAVAYPHDDVSLKRILNVPARGIGKKAVEVLQNAAVQAGVSFDGVLKAVSRNDMIALPPKASRAIADFYKMISSLRKKVGAPLVGARGGGAPQSVRELLEQILERTGYVEALEAEKTIEAQSRIENIEEFFSVIEDFEESDVGAGLRARPATDGTGRPQGVSPTSLESFLESISLMTDLDTWDPGTNVLTLMTLHTAKGLEFPIVYMVGLEEGIFPNINAFTANREDLEEERRLCYVGITRAKDKLFLTYARERRLYGTLQHNLPSRFLNEIPSEVYVTDRAYDRDEEPHEVMTDDEISVELDRDEAKRRILFDGSKLTPT